MSGGGNVQAGHVSRLVEIAACTPAEAEHLLAACDNNVEAAISLFFEQGAGNGDENTMATAEAISVEDSVRAPIAPVREQLVGPEDDNFYRSTPPQTATRRFSRVSQHVKVCPLRDFAREGALMEEQLQGDDLVPHSSSVRLRRPDRTGDMIAVAQATDIFNRPGSSSRLGDLFRPPTDLLYTGSFQAARAHATKRKNWLLVNVQNDNFDSQLLNRDVWSDKEVKKIVRRQFIFWQVDTDSSEGRRFVAFYKCVKLPYMCIIDPRTGEEIWQSTEPNQLNVLSDLHNFLRDHKNFSEQLDLSEDVPSTSKRNMATMAYDDTCESSLNQNHDHLPNKRSKLLELTEEQQIELAIKNSMSEKNSNVNSNHAEVDLADKDDDIDASNINSFDENESKICSYEQKLGSAKNELTALKLRLFNAAGVDEVVQLRWPSDTLLQVLRLYITQQHSHIPEEGYKLISAFPRKLLEAVHNTATLKELGLHPSANLHLTLDE